MKIKVTTFIKLFLVYTTSSLSQTLSPDTVNVVPGDGSVSGKRFIDYENVWIMTDVDKAGKVSSVGVWHDTVRMVYGSAKQLIRKQTVRYANGHIRRHYDKVDAETMLPIHVRVTAQEKEGAAEQVVTDIEYRGSLFSGIRRFNVEGTGPDGALAVRTIMELKGPVFDWHMWGILVSSFPLREGYAARFMAHTSSGTTNSPFLWVVLAVKGSESVQSRRWGKVDCWKVLVQAEVPWTFWISKRMDVAPIQMIRIDQSALGGNISWWEPER